MLGGDSVTEASSRADGEDEDQLGDLGTPGKSSVSEGSKSLSSEKSPYGRNKRHNYSEYKRDFSEQRSYMYCKYLHHPGVSKIQYKAFFHMCRLQSISFDLESRKGTAFML